jgi:type II secretory pathway pseudopilin PulG
MSQGHLVGKDSVGLRLSGVAKSGAGGMMGIMKTPLFPTLLFMLATATLLRAQGAVDWQTLAQEFAQDAAAAQAKYQGQMLTVTGPVASVAQGDMTTDSPSVAVKLSTPDGPGPDVKCLFESEDLAQNTEIYVPDDGSEAILRKRDSAGNLISSEPLVQTGQQVTISGSFLGYQAGDIVLQHCRLAAGATP